MSKPATSAPSTARASRSPIVLRLSVQYATEFVELPRWRLRRWLQCGLEHLRWCDAQLAPAPWPTAISLTVRLVDDTEAQTLNRQFRQLDYATNVLTFDYGQTPDGEVHADIVLCVPVLRREALDQGKTPLAHAAHLSVHGCLHALGYDHMQEIEAQRMEALETAILARLGFADPYGIDHV